MVYRIKDWDKHFENNRSRELKKLDWVPVPNNMNGDGYTDLVSNDNPAELLGTWIAIVEIASICDPRGTLLRNPARIPQGGARGHNTTTLARLSRLPKESFDRAIPVLLRIGWLEQVEDSEEVVQISHDAAPKCEEVPIEQKRIEGNRTGEQKQDSPPQIGSRSSVDKPEKKKSKKQKKVVDMNGKDMVQYFQNRYSALCSGNLPNKLKGATLLKNLIEDIGAEKTKVMIDYLFDNWKSFQKKYKINSGDPSVGVMVGFASSIIADMEGRSAYNPSKRGSQDFAGDPLDIYRKK